MAGRPAEEALTLKNRDSDVRRVASSNAYRATVTDVGRRMGILQFESVSLPTAVAMGCQRPFHRCGSSRHQTVLRRNRQGTIVP